jgi:hypothetical protein
MKRELAVGVLLALTMVTSGCVQAVTGGPVEFEASPATVGSGTLDSTGYELNSEDTVEVNETVEVPVVGERDVRITNHVRGYASPAPEEGSAESASVGAFLVLSTPQAQVAGQGTNPLGRVPLKELITRVASRADDSQEFEQVGTKDVETLGTTATAEKYSTTMEMEGERVDTYVYVVRVAHEGDYVIAVGMTPQDRGNDESSIYEMMRGLEHSGDE